MTTLINNNTYKGFELFNDIEDYILKIRNRAIVLANLAEDNMESKRINIRGAALIIGYFNQIPEDEREDVKKKFEENLAQRGFV